MSDFPIRSSLSFPVADMFGFIKVTNMEQEPDKYELIMTFHQAESIEKVDFSKSLGVSFRVADKDKIDALDNDGLIKFMTTLSK